jgi:hypothetical protein
LNRFDKQEKKGKKERKKDRKTEKKERKEKKDGKERRKRKKEKKEGKERRKKKERERDYYLEELFLQKANASTKGSIQKDLDGEKETMKLNYCSTELSK